MGNPNNPNAFKFARDAAEPILQKQTERAFRPGNYSPIDGRLVLASNFKQSTPEQDKSEHVDVVANLQIRGLAGGVEDVEYHFDVKCKKSENKHTFSISKDALECFCRKVLENAPGVEHYLALAFGDSDRWLYNSCKGREAEAISESGIEYFMLLNIKDVFTTDKLGLLVEKLNKEGKPYYVLDSRKYSDCKWTILYNVFS